MDKLPLLRFQTKWTALCLLTQKWTEGGFLSSAIINFMGRWRRGSWERGWRHVLIRFIWKAPALWGLFGEGFCIRAVTPVWYKWRAEKKGKLTGPCDSRASNPQHAHELSSHIWQAMASLTSLCLLPGSSPPSCKSWRDYKYCRLCRVFLLSIAIQYELFHSK